MLNFVQSTSTEKATRETWSTQLQIMAENTSQTLVPHKPPLQKAPHSSAARVLLHGIHLNALCTSVLTYSPFV